MQLNSSIVQLPKAACILQAVLPHLGPQPALNHKLGLLEMKIWLDPTTEQTDSTSPAHSLATSTSEPDAFAQVFRCRLDPETAQPI